MSSITIAPIKGFNTVLNLPGDKSISHRAAILGLLAEGQTTINNFLQAEDCLNTLKACEQLGAKVTWDNDVIKIEGCGLKELKEPKEIIDCGNSGTAVRLLSGVLAAQPFTTIITGDSQIQKRPMNRIIEPLTRMGAQIESREGGLCPLKIKGNHLTGINYTSNVASAQVKSCILLAGLYASGTTTIIEPSLSRDHTERMFNYFGVKLKRHAVPTIPQKPFSSTLPVQITLSQKRLLKGQTIDVPADISSAAFFMVAAAMLPGAKIKLKHIGINSTRTGLLDVLRIMGVEVTKTNQHTSGGERVADLTITGPDQLQGMEIYGAIIPRLIDELPIIAVLAATAKGETIISDAAELRVKETDRISVLSQELRKIGIDISEKEDGMIIRGGRIKGGHAQSHGDHRLAMSLAIAGLVSEDGVTIDGIECVNTSFPGFWEKLEELKNAAT